MDPSNGGLNQCIDTGNGLNDPIGISVNNDFWSCPVKTEHLC